MVNRLAKLSKTNSFFLFGNRGVGKSTLLEQLFPQDNHPWFDLLDLALEKKLALKPELLNALLEAAKKDYPKGTFVVIDEVQKNPALLDVVHSQIEKKYFHFVLTGSSARKLKKQSANLLGGRAFVYYLYPFTHLELQKNFKLNEVLKWGSLPKIFEFNTEDKIDYLNAYADTYLREEIISEQLVRKILPFRQFLEVAAQSNCKIVNYKKTADAVGVDITTVQNYFQILEDTFVGFLLQPYHESIRQRQRKNPKFYFFDTGVTRTLQNRLQLSLTESTYEYGDLFEQFIILEFIRLNSYYKKSWKFSYIMTKDDVEVDLVIERPGKPKLFIEIKSTAKIDNLLAESLGGFQRLVQDSKDTQGLVISQDPIEKIENRILFQPWQKVFQQLFIEEK